MVNIELFVKEMQENINKMKSIDPTSEEFSKLQDDVHELKFSTVKRIIQKELKIKLDDVFSSFHALHSPLQI